MVLANWLKLICCCWLLIIQYRPGPSAQRLGYNQAVNFEMGNSEHPPVPPQLPVSLEHPHLGQVSTFSTPELGSCFHKVYHYADPIMGQEKLRRVNARMKKFPSCPHILQIKKAQSRTQQQMCATNTDVHLYFEAYSQTLGAVMAARIKDRRNFTQQQIYEFLHRVLQALVFLQDNGFKNCHLDKESIVFCGTTIKILDMGLATSSPYQTFLEKNQPASGFYVPPELFKDIKERNYQPYTSPKSDMFSLGMMLLELACLEPLDCYYNYEDCSIDYESLIHRVSRIVYSTQLKTLIAGMLEYEPELRTGLVGCLQKVRTILNIDSQVESGLRRSRSSSTKMLKQLLTASRKTITASQSNDNSLQRKQSQASLTSMASATNRTQEIGNSSTAHEYGSKIEGIPSNQTVCILKNLVKSKTSNKQFKIANKQENNKQNVNCQRTGQIEGYKLTARNVDNTKPDSSQLGRKKSFGTRTFFENGYLPSKYNSVTPKTQDYLDRINNKKQESIFRLIEEDNRSNKSPNQHLSTSTVPDLSPVLPPVIPRVQKTNSIKRQAQEPQQLKEVTEFSAQRSSQTEQSSSKQQLETLSYKVRRTLDKMYKTTQSISSSQEKQKGLKVLDNNYKKVTLENGFYYEGQLKDSSTFEGNGVLYNKQGRVIYTGSWANSRYDGYGVVYNIEGNYSAPDMRDFSQRNWVKYEGEFSRGEWQGFGTIYFANGEKFSGSMRSGKVNGYGCFYGTGSDMTKGIWVNNRLQI